ncbi:MAG TPA: alanine racemase [Candidatus Limnocylindrales bacterium]
MSAPTSSIEQRLAGAGLPPLPRMAWLELDLDALAGNLAALRALAGGVPVHPVVKADAYGHGAVPIARALVAAGAEGLSVATMDEALELREAGITGPIRVLYAIPPELVRDAVRHEITIAVGDGSTIDALVTAAARDPEGAPLLVEIEVETGLGRGGTTPEALGALVERIDAATVLRLTGVWTHLQASEDAAITGRQLARFEEAARVMSPDGRGLPTRHVAASGGLLTGVDAFDGVRPGLSTYGILPDELSDLPDDTAASFRPVMSLHARPIRVADLPAGYGISYGPSFTTVRSSRIATLPLGYGDGFARAHANRAEALVRGGRVPLVGNVTMDAVMADVTDVPGPPVTLADEFVLLGAQGDERIRAEDLAQQRTTNTWEVVTLMSARLPRVYHAATGAVVGLRTLTGWRG